MMSNSYSYYSNNIKLVLTKMAMAMGISLLISLSIIETFCAVGPPGGYCASDLYMFTDQYTFNTNACYNNPSPLSSPMKATIPFLNAQSDNQYKVAISFKNLDYILLNNLLDIGITYSNPQTSCLDVNVFSANTSNIRLLGIRYLVIKSSFTKLHVSYINLNPNTTLVALGSYFKNVNIVDGLQYFDCSFNAFYAFTSLYVRSPTQLMSFDLQLYGLGAKTQFNAYFNNLVLNETLTIQSFSFVVVRERLDLSSAPMQVTPSGFCDTYINPIYGIFGLSVISDNFINFNISTNNNGLSSANTNNLNATYRHQYKCKGYKTYLDTCCTFPTIYYYPVHNLCYDICPPRLYPNSILYYRYCLPCPYDCFYCNNISKRCLSCSPDDFRQLYSSIGRCVSIFGYFNAENFSRSHPCASDCYSCSSLTVCTICHRGKTSVIGGCSNILGCSEISTNSTNNTEICIGCLDSFQFINNYCVCPLGTWLISNTRCTDVIGCLTASKINGTMQCIFCMQNFTLNDNLCNCISGYGLQTNVNKCVQICGDGRRYVDACDDGNLINGDGCSSSCQMETNYQCINGSKTHSSLCFYTKSYQIKVHSINKTLGQNQGIFVFQILPKFNQIISDSLIVSLSFVCNQNITVKGWSFNNILLTVKVQYTQNLQGNYANLSLKINQTYPMKRYLNITFPMKSGGIKLLIYHNYDKMEIIKKIILGILSFPLLLFALGSMTHKMIGIQILTAFQIILLVSTLSTNYTEPYILFNQLSGVTFNFYYYINLFSNFYSSQPSKWNIYTFSKSNLYFSQEIIGGVILLLTFLPLARLLFRCLMEKDWQKGLRKIDSITRVVYNHILFPFGIGFLYIGVFAYSSHSYSDIHSSDVIILIALMQFLLVMTISQVFFCQWASFIMDRMSISKKKEKQVLIKQGKTAILNSFYAGEPICQFVRCDRNYIPAYLNYIYLIFFLFWTANIYNQPQILFPIAVLVFIATALFIYYRPYDNSIHNAGQIINLLLIFSFSLWVTLRELSPSLTDQDNQIFAIFLIVTLMITALVLTVARVVFEFLQWWAERCPKQLNKFLQQNAEKQKKILEADDVTQKIQKMNPFRLKTQLLGEYNQKWNQMNKERLCNNVSPLSNDIFRKQIQNDRNNRPKNNCKQMKFKPKDKQINYLKAITKNSIQNGQQQNTNNQINRK